MGFPVEVKREVKVVEVYTDQLEVCKPKVIGVWSWRRMKTVKHVLHLHKDGTVVQYEVS